MSISWGLARISSAELSEWHAILTLEQDEQTERDEAAKSKAKAKDDPSKTRRLIGGKRVTMP